MNDEEDFSSFRVHHSSFSKSFLVKIDQFHRRGGGFKPLVPQLDSRAINCLVYRVGSYHSENYGHSRLQRRFPDTSRHFAGDVLEVWGLTTNNCTDADDRIKLSRAGKLESQKRNLESSRDFVNRNQFLVRSQTLKSIKRTVNQSRANEIIPTTGDNRETKFLSLEMTFVSYWLQECAAPFRVVS
jgi:hypothetical protein